MSIESPADLEGMKQAGRLVAQILAEMRAAARPGMTTAELDAIGGAAMRRHDARSAPQMIYGFPGFTCISVNEQIVHGVPGDRRLQVGDAVKIDVTVDRGGFIADAATTVLIGSTSGTARRLKQSALAALTAALDAARAGERVGAIGRAVERQVRRDGFSVIRELCGHGVGRQIHEEPEVANYDSPFATTRLTDGLVIAIEPMLAARPARAVQQPDGWTIATDNGCLAVHEEHTVMIRNGAPLILTA